ncbi:putative serine/threonine-protein kinase CHK1 like protein [Dictyocoela muelleri]|nr:putative serine/threonine-protein kinase CHK1 like protein [Dictyocoela muelleri]
MEKIIFEKTIGYGASAIVKKAQIGTKKVAIKIIDVSKTSLKSIYVESTIQKMMKHKNIMKLYSSFVVLASDEFKIYLKDLKVYLKEVNRNSINNKNLIYDKNSINNKNSNNDKKNVKMNNDEKENNKNYNYDNNKKYINDNNMNYDNNNNYNNNKDQNYIYNKDQNYDIENKKHYEMDINSDQNLIDKPPLYCYLIMELADNELFYFIEPGTGIGCENVHFYFKQLMDAVFYLHSKNICHRDIKPENILLDKNCNLLLTDFGHSTVIKDRNGQHKALSGIAGSRSYMAPEIFSGCYKGDEVDIWSSGIVLIVLSTGRLPWQNPDYRDEEFEAFFRLSRHNYAPWSELDGKVLKLFEGMCALKNRFKKEDIEKNEWFRKDAIQTKLFKHKVISFSQPNQRISSPTDSFISSQPNPQKFRRVYVADTETRVFMNILEILEKLAVKFYPSKDNFLVSYDTIDRKGQPLIGEFCVKKIDEVVSVSINRLRGDSLEFKRFCNIVFENLKGYE